MTASELKDKELEIKDRNAREDRKSREYVAHHQIIGNIGAKAIPQVKFNDPEWYKRIPGSVLSNTNLSTFHRYNLYDVTISEGSNSSIGIRANCPSYIGVYSIAYAPTIGSGRQDISTGTLQNDVSGGSINAALNRVLSQLEKRNSRVTTYSRDTIGRYIFIGGDILSDLITLKVVIELYDYAKAKFPYLAPTMIKALGFNAASVRSNIAWLKSEYVRLVSVFNNSVPVPADLSYISRKLWIASHIIVDHVKSPSQLMAFCKVVTYSLDSTDTYTAIAIDSTGYDAVSYVRSIEERIDGLCNGATWKPVIRDLRGGMPEKAFIKLPDDLNSSVLVVSEVDEVREQFHNMDCVPYITVSPIENANVICDFGVIFKSFSVGGNAKEQVCQGLGYYANSPWTGENRPGLIALGQDNGLADIGMPKLNNCFKSGYSVNDRMTTQVSLNFFHDIVKDDDLLTATRLKATWRVDALTADVAAQLNSPLVTETGRLTFLTTHTIVNTLSPITMGTELVLGIKAMNFDATDPYNEIMDHMLCTALAAGSLTTNVYNVVFTNSYVLQEMDNRSVKYFAAVCGYAQQVDWIPLMQVVGLNGIDFGYKYTVGELSNYFTIDTGLYARINRQCVESEFTLRESAFLKPLA